MTQGATTDMTDEQLMALFSETKAEIYFNELHRRHSTGLTYYAKRVNPLGDDADADDIVQQAFLNMCANLDRFDPGMKFRPWLYSLLANHAINQKISSKRKKMVSLDAVRETGSNNHETLFDPPDTRELGPYTQVITNEESNGLRELVGRLRPQQREVMERLYFQGMTSEQVAADMGISLGTVKSRLGRSLESLREWAAATLKSEAA